MIIAIIQIVISVLLIITILLQQRGGGLSGIFGGETFYGTRRGAEKMIFIATIILIIAFLTTGILNLFIK